MKNDVAIAISEIGHDPSSYRELRLPAGVCEKMEKRIQGSQFASLEEFLTFVMHAISSSDTSQMECEERELLEQRLRDLGYL